MTSKENHHTKSYIFFGWLSDSRFSKTFPFHFPWFLWLTAPWFPPWVGFTMSQVLWSKALAHSAALSKVGTWKTDWFSGWKTWKDAKGTQKRKDRFFVFVNYAFLLSLCSVSFKEDVSGKWVMRLEMNVRTANLLACFELQVEERKKPTHVTN